MTTLNNMQDYNRETAKRATVLLSNGDEAKIEEYFKELKVASLHIRDNYPDTLTVVKDFKSWTAMTKDVLNHSVGFMQLIFTPEEITDILAACDDTQGMYAYWEEVIEDLSETTTSEDILEPFEVIINH